MLSIRNRHFLVVDVIFLVLASYVSFALRLDGLNFKDYVPSFFIFTLCAAIITPLVFGGLGIYSRYWRYASIDELMLLSGSVTVATLAVSLTAYLISFLNTPAYAVPRSIPFIFLLLALAVTATPRFLLRATGHYVVGRQRRTRADMTPVLIVGAGSAGHTIARELRENPQLGLEAVGFLDDDSHKWGVQIQGVMVIGPLTSLPEVVNSHNIKEVIIAMPTAPGQVVRRIKTLCEELQVATRIIPGLYELIGGTVNVRQLREVKIEDLLRRTVVESDPTPVHAMLRGRIVMVSGGGGSIGAELCRQIAHCSPARLVILDHGENNLYYILNELKARHPQLPIEGVIADIRDRAHLNVIFRWQKAQVIFHAAAHKHVPLMEENPCEAITNNVKGTRNLVELAVDYGVAHFVMISTDKAVNPTSVMGASKRTAERIVQQAAKRTGHAYVAVRFGNVLGSSGSVVPLFQQQIAAGGPVTVTHPDMTRFFMTIPEAVQLVLQAGTLGRGGEVYILDMGEQVRIVDLARDLIRLSGLRPDEDIEIVYSGVRPGEKLYEELISTGESHEKTRHPKIFMLRDAIGVEWDSFGPTVDKMITAAEARRDGEIRPLLKTLVPDYQVSMKVSTDGELTPAPIGPPSMPLTASV